MRNYFKYKIKIIELIKKILMIDMRAQKYIVCAFDLEQYLCKKNVC